MNYESKIKSGSGNSGIMPTAVCSVCLYSCMNSCDGGCEKSCSGDCHGSCKASSKR